MELSRWKIIALMVVGFVFVTSLSAAASSRAGKDFFKNFGRASVATWNDVTGQDNFHLAAEVETAPKTQNENLGVVVPLKETVESPVQKITSTATSIISAITSSPVVKEVIKFPAEILAVATTATTPPPPQKIPEATSTPISPKDNDTHIVISEIQIRSVNSTYNDFVVLFNSGWKEKDISGWQLCKKTKTGTANSIKKFPSGSIIPAKGKFVWANSSSSFYLTVDANVWTSDTIASNNSIALFSDLIGTCVGNQVDAVAWGDSVMPFIEGSALPNPEPNQLIQRKFNQDVPIDTNNNLSDFEIK